MIKSFMVRLKPEVTKQQLLLNTYGEYIPKTVYLKEFDIEYMKNNDLEAYAYYDKNYDGSYVVTCKYLFFNVNDDYNQVFDYDSDSFDSIWSIQD